MKFISYFLPGLIIILGITACNSDKKAESASKDKVRVQLSWLHTIEFAAFYMAEAKGDYKDANLEVTLNGGGFDEAGNFIDPIEEVLAGNADFGILDGTLLLTARAEGKPIVAVATIYQQHPLALVSLADKGIIKPQDLMGTTVQISGTSTVVFQALLRSQGIAPDSLTVVERTDFTTAPLLNEETDIIDGWVTNEATLLMTEGHDINMILPSDYGIDLYPNVIFTTEEMITRHPDLVQRFLKTTLAGMQRAIDDPAGAAKLAVKYDSNLSVANETASMQQSLPLLLPANSHPGMMKAGVWEFTHQMLLDEGILEFPLDIQQAYTLKFLDALYAGE